MAKKKPTYTPPTTFDAQLAEMDRMLASGYQIRQREPEQQEKAPPKERGAVRAVGDMALALGQGVAGSVKSLTDLAGADNAVSRGLDSASKGMEGWKSEQSQALRKQHMAAIKAAEDSGSLADEVAAYANMVWDMPGESLAQGIGSFATLGFGKAVQGLKLAQAAKAAGMSKEAFIASKAGVDALAKAQAVGFKTNLGVGMLQGAGAVKGSQYEQTYNNAIAQGMAPEQAEQLAAEAQSYAKGGMQQALGAGLGFAAAKTGPIEKLVSGQGVGAGGIMRRTAGGFGTEFLTEGAQGGQERYAGNTAAVDAGVLDPSKRFTGVAGQAVSEGMVGGVLGGGAGALGGSDVAPAAGLPAVTPGDQIRATETVPEAGPMTRAANVATEQKARAADTLGASLTGTAPANLMQGAADPLMDALRAPVEQPAAEQSAQPLDMVPQGVDPATGEVLPPAVQPERLDFTGKTDEELQQARKNAQDPAIRRALATELQARRAAAAPKPDPFENAAPAAMDGDILNPKGEPFKTKMAADRAAKQTPGEVVAVAGGFAIRPQQESASEPATPTAEPQRAEATADEPAAADAAGGQVVPPATGAAAGALSGAADAQAQAPSVFEAGQDKPATLPTNLAGAKERYNYGKKGFDLAFDNDIDRAAYITALTKPDGKRSAKDADYLKFAMDATGMTEAEVRAHGQKVKDSIKAQADGAEPGALKVPGLYAPKAAPAAKPAAPDVTLTDEGKTSNQLDDINSVPDSVFSAFTDMQQADSGLISINQFTEPEQESLRKAGLVKSGVLESGETHEGVNPESLWRERKRRFDAAREKRKGVSEDERNAGIEKRAQRYEQLADEQDALGELGDQAKAAEYRSKAAEIRGRKSTAKAITPETGKAAQPAPAQAPAVTAESASTGPASKFKVGDSVRIIGETARHEIESIGKDGWIYTRAGGASPAEKWEIAPPPPERPLGDGDIFPPATKPVKQPATSVAPEEGAGGSQPPQAAPAKPKTASKEDLDHLFGLDQKRQKAIDRINKGTAYFATQEKAADFIKKSGIKDTHEVVQTKSGKFEIKAKVQAAPNTPATTAQPALGPFERERKARIDSILKHGGSVINGRLRTADGLTLIALDDHELAAIPDDKKDADSPQSRWTRATTAERIAIARAGGILLKPAENVAKKAWDKHDPVVQEKLARGLQKQEAAPKADLQNAMDSAGWTAEVAGADNTIWTKQSGRERYTAMYAPDSNNMEVTVLVDGVDTQISSFKVTTPGGTAKAANKAVNDDAQADMPKNPEKSNTSSERVDETAKNEQVDDPSLTGPQKVLNGILDPNKSIPLDDLDPATHEVDIGFLKMLHDKVRNADFGKGKEGAAKKQRKVGYLLAAIQEKEEGRGGIGPRPTKPADDKVLGQNENGQTLMVGANGVRYYKDGNFKISEPVRLRPTREGVEADVVDRRDEFKTVEELAADKPAAPRRIQPGEPGYTLAMAREDLQALYDRNGGMVEDARINSRIKQQEKLVKDMEAEQAKPTTQTDPVKPARLPEAVQDALENQLRKQRARISRLSNEASKAVSMDDKKAAMLKVQAAEATQRKLRTGIFEAEDAAQAALEAKNAALFAPHADFFPDAAEAIAKALGQNDELDAEMRSYEAKADKPAAPVKPVASANTVFTEDAAAAARARLKAKLGRLNSGIDPETLMDGITLAGYHIEKGARTFAAYAKAMVADLGDGVKPYLKSWYMGVKYDPRAAAFDGMDGAAAVESADIDAITAPDEPAAEVSAELRQAAKDAGAEVAKEIHWWQTKASGKARVQGAVLNALVSGMENPPASLDAVAAEIVEELAAVENQAKQADTDEKDKANATRELDSPSTGALGGKPAGDVRAPDEGRDAGAGLDGGGRGDGQRNAGADDAGVQGTRGLGDGAGGTSVPAGRGRKQRGSTAKRGVSADEAAQPDEGLFGPAGGLTPDTGANPAPNAPAIPAPQLTDFTITDELALGEGGQKTKFKNNVAAIRLLAELESTGRLATPDEQAVLAKYVGWGGLPQAFDPENANWSKEHAEIKALMTPDELAAAARSTRYAHYTSKEIIQDGIYAALRQFGFTGGKTLEAGAGVGNFIGLMPHDMRSAGRFTAVEREPFSSAIARHLYPLQNVQRADFTEFKGSDGYFDAVVGNFPFASDPQTDRSGRKHLSGLSLHNYFFAKSIDMLREGGVIAEVITNSFLDAKGDRARKYMSDRAEFLGAIRLPNSAFAKNANTEVTTDIVFLKKRPDSEVGGKAAREDAKRWLDTGIYTDKNGKKVALNQYFIDNPHMMLGDFGAFGSMYGPDQPALVARPGQDTLALLKEAVSRLPAGVYQSIAETNAMVDAAVVALKNPTVKEGGYFIEGDKLMQRLPDIAGEARGVEITPATQWTAKTTLGQAGFERIKALAAMRVTVRGLIAAEMSDDAPSMKQLRATLNEQYDAYRDTHGLINDPSTLRVFDDDPDFPLLASLEHGYTPGIGPAAAKQQGIKPTKSTAKKGPIFSQRVVAARQTVQKVDTPADALAVSMAERGKLDAAYIGQLLGQDPLDVLKELSSGENPLLFRDPATDEYVLRDAYLSGNVRAKLAQAKEAGMFANVTALEAVQPPDVGSHEITARLGSPWVPTEVYADFAKTLYGEDARVSVVYLPTNSSFSVLVYDGSGVAMTNTWGTPDYPGDALLQAVMNNRSIKVTYRDSEGKTHTDVEATEKANEKAAEIKAKFSDWLFTDPERSEVLTKAYNETNNNYVTRVYDGANMTFPGKVPDSVIKFRRHQRNAIARIVQDRTALLDHVVGAGKTFTVIAAAMELKRTGLARKPMVAVPNHLVKQWAADFYRLYPGANVLTATKKDFEKANRRKFLAKIATGDWDAVVIAHSSFGFIKPSPEFEAEFNRREIAKIMATIKTVEDGDGDKQAKKRTVKQLEGMKERLENRIKSLRDKPMDDLLDFEQIGVDQLFVDEAHLFKNLMYTTKMQGVSGLNDPTGSQRAYDMYVKTNQIMEKNGRGQGVVFATGTPVSNSLAEMYHMMRYLMPEQMAALGFESFDAWANTYASVDQVWFQAPSGDGFKAQNRMSNFVNTPELLKMFDQVSDTVTMDDIKKAYAEENNGAEFPLPKVKGGRRAPVSLDKSEAQDDYMAQIAQRAKAIELRKGPPQKGDDNILVVMGDARKAAMDIRLVAPDITVREKGGRIDRSTDEVVARYRQYDKVKGTQIVFSDLGTPLKHAKKELAQYEALQARIQAATEEVAASATLGNEAAMETMEDAEAAQAELDAMGADWLGAVKSAMRGFSVYDDFKAALIEKGIPEHEIAFIHDYNTDDQKAGLFRKVNAGQIRVLLGSTAKLGAGTNVQERLVALHHLDVPWRPSDVEQREGRIERQGNRLMTEWPDFEVEILAYVTKDTLDMRMWQVQETKLKMINQLRTRKIGREIDNAFEDMELSAGEMQAAATGDMNLLKEIQLRNDVKKLEQRRRAFDGQRNDLISRKRRNAEMLRTLPAQVEAAAEEAKFADQYLSDRFDSQPPFKMNIDGKNYTDAKEAQAVLRRLEEATEEVKALNGEVTTKKAPLSVTIDGELIKNRAVMAELFANARGDLDPIAWTVNGETYRRRTVLANAIRQGVVDAIADESTQPVGKIGAYDVAVEGNTGKGGLQFLEVTMSRGGKVVMSNSMLVNDTAAAPGRVVTMAENLLAGAVQKADHLERTLARAKKDAVDLAKTEDTGEWPDQPKLDAARQAHKDVLALLKKKDEAHKPEADGDAPAFSRGRAANGVTQKTAQDVVDGIKARWANAPEVVVVADMQDRAIPERVRDADAEQRSQGASGEPEGFFYKGKVYIVAGALNKPADVVRVLFHESLGHYGLRGVFGDRLTPILKQLAALRRADVAAKALEYGLDMANESDRLQAAEEVLAVLAQTRPKMGYVQRAVAAVRAWLRKHVPGFQGMRLTDAEIIQQFILPARRFVEGGGGGPRGGLPAFSRPGTAGADEFSQTESRIGGVAAYETARNAGDTQLTYRQWVQVRTPSFKKWWGYDWERTGRTDADGRRDAGGQPGNSGQASSVDGRRGQDSSDQYPAQEGAVGREFTFINDRTGEPRVFLHGTRDQFTVFDEFHPHKNDLGWLGRGHYFTTDEAIADLYARKKKGVGKKVIMDVFVRPNNPRYLTNEQKLKFARLSLEGNQKLTQILKSDGNGGAAIHFEDGSIELMTFDPAGIKSATGNNGDFDPTNPDIRFSRTLSAPELAGQVRDRLNETFNHPGKLSWWHKTVGSQYNLAERSPAYKRVFDAAQSFINDVSYYGTEAANMAPKILPKLETFKDLAKTAISAADNKAVAAPVFEGTLSWARDADGKPARIEDLEAAYASLTDEQKARMLLRKGAVSEKQLQAWKANPLDIYTGAVRNRFEATFLKPGIVWTDAELKSLFGLNEAQTGLYREFRAATDASMDNMAKAQMLRAAGKDAVDLRDVVMDAPDLDTAAQLLRQALLDLARDNPDRADVLTVAANGVLDTAAKVRALKTQGYAPLSRFGRFTVDVVVDGKREYFSLFETEREANQMAAKMREEFGAENVAQGTMSQKEFELFQGITPESLELFGNMLGLDATGNEAQDKAFQTYLQLTKNNRSAMKRLIHRKGVAGYSQDVGRVLAAFVYANARQTSAALHIGQMDEAIAAIPKGQGELKDHALELAQYIKEPREEAAAFRGLLFAQYLGGSVASAMVNFTQPLTVSVPYLSQFGGLKNAGAAWAKAVNDMRKGVKLEAGLERALKDAEESGVVSPQEIHQLMAQARGAATLRSGDGTRRGDAVAKLQNGWTRTALAWGKLFGYAEQVNRRSTFIAAYRMAVEQGMANPGAFATKAVNETQFINNKANKMKFGRGAIGATLMTFKSYSLNWLELMHRLSTQGGPEGKLAAAYMLAALLLVAGTGGLPFADDIEDLIDAIAQKAGYNFSTEKAKQEFLESLFGQAGAQFVDRGLTGIPGVPIDISGRMGMANLLPGTGLLLEKRDSTRDATEVLGPAGDMVTRFFKAAGALASGEVGTAVEQAAPRAVANMVKGVDMASTGMYRDTKGAKVIDTTAGEALSKFIGFQPSSVSKVQEANFLNQRAKDFYSLRTQEIRAKWATGIFLGDQDKVAAARQEMLDWNEANPQQRMTANMPAILKKVREMRKTKAQRIADTAPKAMREQMRREAQETEA